MSKILPPKENINVLAEPDVDTNSTSGDKHDIQNTILNRQLEESSDVSNIEDSVSGTLPNPEGTVTRCYDDTIDSKDFQKELMNKVFPLSEENATDVTDIDSNAISNDNEDYQTYLDHISKTVGDNADSLESKVKKDKKNKDKGKSKKEKKEIKRKSNLVPLDAFFSPTDGPLKKKKVDNDISSQSTPKEFASNELCNVPNLANIKVKEEEILGNIKEEVKDDLEEGEIDESAIEEGEIAEMELEEGELRELEEGELPEDIEMVLYNFSLFF